MDAAAPCFRPFLDVVRRRHSEKTVFFQLQDPPVSNSFSNTFLLRCCFFSLIVVVVLPPRDETGLVSPPSLLHRTGRAPPPLSPHRFLRLLMSENERQIEDCPSPPVFSWRRFFAFSRRHLLHCSLSPEAVEVYEDLNSGSGPVPVVFLFLYPSEEGFFFHWIPSPFFRLGLTMSSLDLLGSPSESSCFRPRRPLLNQKFLLLVGHSGAHLTFLKADPRMEDRMDIQFPPTYHYCFFSVSPPSGSSKSRRNPPLLSYDVESAFLVPFPPVPHKSDDEELSRVLGRLE